MQSSVRTLNNEIQINWEESSAIYALDVYDVVTVKESIHATYAEKTASIIEQLGLNVVAGGDIVIREIVGQARNHFVVVQFPDLEVFEELMEGLKAAGLHHLREDATENYIWTLYEAWGFGD